MGCSYEYIDSILFPDLLDDSCCRGFREKAASAGINIPILTGLMPIAADMKLAGCGIKVVMTKELKSGIARWSVNRIGLLNFSANY